MLNSNKDNVNKEREFNFAKRLREILKGDYNDEFIAAGHLSASKTKGTPLKCPFCLLVETKRIELSTLRMRTVRSPS